MAARTVKGNVWTSTVLQPSSPGAALTFLRAIWVFKSSAVTGGSSTFEYVFCMKGHTFERTISGSEWCMFEAKTLSHWSFISAIASVGDKMMSPFLFKMRLDVLIFDFPFIHWKTHLSTCLDFVEEIIFSFQAEIRARLSLSLCSTMHCCSCFWTYSRKWELKCWSLFHQWNSFKEPNSKATLFWSLKVMLKSAVLVAFLSSRNLSSETSLCTLLSLELLQVKAEPSKSWPGHATWGLRVGCLALSRGPFLKHAPCWHKVWIAKLLMLCHALSSSFWEHRLLYLEFQSSWAASSICS